MEAFPKIRNQCSVAVNIECKKEKYKNKGKKTWPKLLPVKSPVGSWAVNQKTLKKKKKKVTDCSGGFLPSGHLSDQCTTGTWHHL